MLGVFKYSNVNAKVKGMYAKFLESNDYDELSKQKTVKEVLVLLKSKLIDIPDIDDNSKRTDIELELYKIVWSDMTKISRLLDKKDKEILKLYMKKHDIRDKMSSQLENSIYKEYFTNLYKECKKIKNKPLIDLVGKQIDLLNILWAFRAQKYYHIDKNQLDNYEINIHHKLNREVLEKIRKEQEPLEDIIESTIYNIDGDEELFEREIQKYLYRLYFNYFNTQEFSLTMVIAYLELRIIQIKNIITIIEGVQYNIDEHVIQKKLIQ